LIFGSPGEATSGLLSQEGANQLAVFLQSSVGFSKKPFEPLYGVMIISAFPQPATLSAPVNLIRSGWT
jgi:hypothetical protein